MKLDELLTILRSSACGQRAIQTAADYRPFPLNLSFASCNAGISWLCEQYRNMGLKTEKIDFPADGRTIYADRHYPPARDVEDGRLKATDPAFHPSTLTAVMARLEGTDPREKSFMISAQADDVAGVAVCVEAARILAELIGKGSLPKPRRGIQLFHGHEPCGLYAYALQNPGIKNILCGLTIDGPGYQDRGAAPESLKLLHCSHMHPSFWHALSEQILSATTANYKVVENGFASSDDMLNDPMFGPAWNLICGRELVKAGFYHSNAGTIERLSQARMAECAVFAAASAYMVANAGKDDALPLAKLTCQNATKQFLSENAALMDGISSNNDEIRERGIAIQSYNTTVVPAVMAAIESPLQLLADEDKNDFLQPMHELAAQFKKTADVITGSALDGLAAILNGQAKTLFKSGDTPIEKNAATLVPARCSPGLLGLENQTEETRMEAARLAGYGLDKGRNFMAPKYYWFDGQRTLLDAAMAYYATTVKGNRASRETRMAILESFKEMTAFLEKHGYLDVAHVPLPPLVNNKMIVDGLKKIGIQSGDLVFVHSSLSQFGEIQGGPDMVIDALMEVIGHDGILAMPAFTLTADGETDPPFDPNSSIAYTGMISNTFWRRKDVLRNSHPTHSIAAWGRRSAEFLTGENPGDTFDWNGPWGKLFRWNGKILTFGETMGATTYLHALEGWFLCYLDKTYARIKEGDGEKLVYIINYPNGCRGGWYDLKRAARHFKRLYSARLYRETKIGAAAALAINVRDLTREIHALLKEEPAVFLHKSGCLPCAERRARLTGWKIPETLPDNTTI